MPWTDVNEVTTELGLSSDPSDLQAIRQELRRRSAELHPDRNEGKFESQEAEERFHLLIEAKDYVDSVGKDATALVPVSQIPALMRALKEASTEPVEVRVSRLRSECRDEYRSEHKRQYAFRKIGSGVFASICAFLFAFGNTLKDHPLLGSLAANQTAQVFLLVLCLYAAGFFALTWFRERAEEGNLEWLMSEEGRREVFRKVIQERSIEETGDKVVVSRLQFSQAIQKRAGGGRRIASPASVLFRFMGSRGLTPAIAEKMARIHLTELEERGAVKRLSTPSLDVLYEINPGILGRIGTEDNAEISMGPPNSGGVGRGVGQQH